MKYLKPAAAAVIAVAGPPLIMFAYLSLFYGHRGVGEHADETALAIAIAAGLIALNTLRLRLVLRVVANLLYICLAPVLLFIFSLGYVCGVYHSCL